MQYVGKGADPDNTFWERGKYGVTFYDFKENLSRNQAVEMQATQYTPLLFSADRKNSDFTNFLMAFKPNTSVPGEEYQFTRKISQVRTNHVPMLNMDNGGRHGRPRLHMDVYEQTNVLTDDGEKPLHILRFDPHTEGVRREAHPGKTTNAPHMHVHNANITRVF